MKENFFELYNILLADKLKKSDAVVWLQGDGHKRGQRTKEIYVLKLAKHVVISGNDIFSSSIKRSGEANIKLSEMKAFLLENSVNEKNIIVDSKAFNTRDQARNVIGLAKKEKVEGHILVGSAYHQPRVWLTFVKVVKRLGYRGKIYNQLFFDNSTKWSGSKAKLEKIPLIKKEIDKIQKYQSKNDVVSYKEGFDYFRQNRKIKNIFNFRKAALTDAEILLKWRNDLQTRKSSYNSKKISSENHIKWLKRIISDPNREIFIAEYYGIPVGTVRSDRVDDFTNLSWTIAPEARCRGIGKEIVLNFSKNVIGRIFAEVKKDNIASRKIAEFANMKIKRERNGIIYYQKNDQSIK